LEVTFAVTLDSKMPVLVAARVSYVGSVVTTGWRGWKMPRAGGRARGPPASKLKASKYISAHFNYLKIFIYYVFFM